MSKKYVIRRFRNLNFQNVLYSILFSFLIYQVSLFNNHIENNACEKSLKLEGCEIYTP